MSANYISNTQYRPSYQNCPTAYAFLASSKIRFIAGCCLLVLLISGCSSQQAVEPAADTEINRQQATDDTQRLPPQPVDDQRFRDGILALQSNNLNKAQKLFLEFITVHPRLAGAYVNLALIHFNKGETQQALDLLNEALELNPQQAQALNLRAQIQMANGKINTARDDFLTAIRLKPDYINAQYNLALLYDIYYQDITLAIRHYEIYMSLLKKTDEATLEWINHLKGTLKNG